MARPKVYLANGHSREIENAVDGQGSTSRQMKEWWVYNGIERGGGGAFHMAGKWWTLTEPHGLWSGLQNSAYDRVLRRTRRLPSMHLLISLPR